jgi:hypothetical protein
VLADQKAETIAEPRLTVVVAIIVSVGRSELLSARFSRVRSGSPTEFLDRTEPDAIGLAERTVDSAGFGNAHLGAVNHRGDVRRIGISVADKAARARRFVYGRLKDPATCARI